MSDIPLWTDADYRERLVRAVETLDSCAQAEMSHDPDSARRLAAKASGVQLALSYFDEMQRCRA